MAKMHLTTEQAEKRVRSIKDHPTPKLSDYHRDLANIKVSTIALIHHLEALKAVADDAAKVREWGERFWLELGKCEVY